MLYHDGASTCETQPAVNFRHNTALLASIDMMEDFNVFEDFANPDCTANVLLDRIKRFQIHDLNRNRKCDSEYYQLFPILRKYEDKFKEYTRMSVGTFDYILSKSMMPYSKIGAIYTLSQFYQRKN